MPVNKLNDFINIINSKIGCAYIWGGQNDEILTKEKLQWFINKFGRNHYYYSTYSAEKWIGKQGYYDCSGLVVYTLQKLGFINSDYSASGIYSNLCTPIKKAELKAGDLVFVKGNTGITHIGVYVGNNRVTHARSCFYGVCQTALFDSFNTFGRLKFFKQEEEEDNDMTVKEFQALRKIEVDNVVGNQTISEFLKVAEDYYKMKQILKDLNEVKI